ncbi:TrkA family potassium uptake protein [Oscillospiraceae bacterium 21-37]|uniref:potassium channel family protein n=1 Tax=Eubacteriales TaxID=186802 RepID=UPI001369FFD6|nr:MULTISPECIES: TrkA family potassium uptake protein [unclassified Neglectibacter]
MNILIVGGGLLGRRIAQMLDELGHSVSIVDESEDNLAQLSDSFQGVTAQGFPMDMNALRQAGIEGCDAVAAVTSDDNLNIAVGQMAKDVFGVPKVVARISDPDRESIFQKAGLLTACPTNMAADKLAAALISPFQARQVTFGEATISLQSRLVERKMAGHTTAHLEPAPEEGLFGLIKKGGRFLLFQGEPLALEAGDLVVYSRVID